MSTSSKTATGRGNAMKLSFRRVAILIALSFFILALTLMFAPNVLLASWGLEFTSSVGVVCRRAAALFSGIAVMFFLARNAEPRRPDLH